MECRRSTDGSESFQGGEHHLGQRREPLFFDKNNPDVKFVSPTGGTIKDIVYGERRAIQEIIISVDWNSEYVTFDSYTKESLEKLSESHIEPMKVVEEKGNGGFLYGCNLTCDLTGRFGFTVRVTPVGDTRVKTTPRLLTWA